MKVFAAVFQTEDTENAPRLLMATTAAGLREKLYDILTDAYDLDGALPSTASVKEMRDWFKAAPGAGNDTIVLYEQEI